MRTIVASLLFSLVIGWALLGGLRSRFIAAAEPVAERPTAKQTDAPKEITNSIGQKLVLIPAGEFLMGDPDTPEEVIKMFPTHPQTPTDFADEYPRHKVKITKPYFMGRCETTVGQFKKFVAATGYKTEGEQETTTDKRGPGAWGFNLKAERFEGRDPKFNWRNPGFPLTDDMPVVDVSWNDAIEFLKWLSKQEGKTYRLPTEAEWEYACRGGTNTQYWNSSDPESLTKVGNVADRDFCEKFPTYHFEERCLKSHDGQTLPAPVGGYPANPFGLYDMHGNAWEWTNDWYGEKYYEECNAKGTVEDPPGPASGGMKARRGGSWHTLAFWCRASYRNYNTPVSRYPNLGFRVVMNAE